MTSAANALMLPRARLTDPEKVAAASLCLDVDAYINTHMEFRGCYDFTTKELRGNVIAYVNQALRREGWMPQWQPLYEKDPKDKQKNVHSGWKLTLMPTDEAYDEATRKMGN